MAVKFTMKSTRELLKARGLLAGDTAQKFVDGEVLRRCAPMVPFDSGALNRSGTTNTRLGSGEVRYATPYARRWYYRPANFTGVPMRGNYWFERMKQNGGQKTVTEDCVTWLRGYLKVKGPTQRMELVAAGAGLGFKESAIKRAAGKLAVQIERTRTVPPQTVWSLPGRDADE